MEESPSTFEEGLDRQLRRARELMLRKQHDYGPGNIMNTPLTDILSAWEIGGIDRTMAIEMGIFVRLFDKISRMNEGFQNAGKTAVPGETLEDTWRDIVGYGLIALMVRDGHFELPMEFGKDDDAELSWVHPGQMNMDAIREANGGAEFIPAHTEEFVATDPGTESGRDRLDAVNQEAMRLTAEMPSVDDEEPYGPTAEERAEFEEQAPSVPGQPVEESMSLVEQTMAIREAAAAEALVRVKEAEGVSGSSDGPVLPADRLPPSMRYDKSARSVADLSAGHPAPEVRSASGT